MSRWPSASRHITASSIGSILPCTTWAMFAVMASNSDANARARPPSECREFAARSATRMARSPAARVDGRSPQAADRLRVPVRSRAMATYLAIDVGTDRLAAGVVDDAGAVVVRDRVATPPRDVWPALHRLVRRVVAARPDDADPLELCGVSCEGPIDRDRGTVSPLHLPVWQDFELRERVRDLTGLPTVLGAAAQARVLAERWTGAAVDVDDVMVLLVSDAVEAGVDLQRAAAARAARQRRPARPRRRRARRAAVPVRRHRLPDGVRLVVGDRGGDQPAAAAGAGVGRRAHRDDDRPGRGVGGRRVRPAPRAARRAPCRRRSAPAARRRPARARPAQPARPRPRRRRPLRAPRPRSSCPTLGSEAPLVGAAALARWEPAPGRRRYTSG